MHSVIQYSMSYNGYTVIGYSDSFHYSIFHVYCIHPSVEMFGQLDTCLVLIFDHGCRSVHTCHVSVSAESDPLRNAILDTLQCQL
jgi:citrate synthase